jgi:hypothetical protein
MGFSATTDRRSPRNEKKFMISSQRGARPNVHLCLAVGLQMAIKGATAMNRVIGLLNPTISVAPN